MCLALFHASRDHAGLSHALDLPLTCKMGPAALGIRVRDGLMRMHVLLQSQLDLCVLARSLAQLLLQQVADSACTACRAFLDVVLHLVNGKGEHCSCGIDEASSKGVVAMHSCARPYLVDWSIGSTWSTIHKVTANPGRKSAKDIAHRP